MTGPSEKEVCHCGLGIEDHKYPGAAEHEFVPKTTTKICMTCDGLGGKWSCPDCGALASALGTGTRALKGREEIAKAILHEWSRTGEDRLDPLTIELATIAADAILSRGIADEAGEK